ncbi:MAG: hypothetical protein E3J60_03460 [Dehalococcoidia bacterium]|nr:MAG: hypothetical protein E3J60_03460 [Dehalococcoidia bacterium]
MRGRQISSGPEDFSLLSSDLLVNDQPAAPGDTVEVDALKTSEIEVVYQIANADPRSWGDPIGVWRSCLTVFDVTNNRAIDSDLEDDSGYGCTDKAGVKVGQINKPTKFRLKIWANQALASAPPKSYW